MTRAQRTLLFVVLGVSFVLIAATLLLYSQGYRIDITEGRITQTGAFYFKVQPKSVDIYIDDELVKRTDFLFGSALTKSFFPQTYQVRIEKEGYYPWQKALAVQSKLVTEAKNIVLFPTTTQFQLIEDNILALWPSPDGKKLLIQTETPSKRWSLSIFDLATESKKSIFTQQISDQDILYAEWYPDDQKPTILFQVNSGEAISNYAYQLDRRGECNISPCLLALGNGSVGTVTFSPVSSESILLTRSTSNSEVLLQTSLLQKDNSFHIIADDVIAFTKQGSSVLWIDSSGQSWKKDIVTGEQNSLSVSTFAVQRETQYSLFGSEKALFLQEARTLYRLKGASETPELLFENVTQLTFSPDGRFLATASSSEIWLYLLENQVTPVERQAGDKVFLNCFGESISNLAWFNANYLIFSSGDAVKVTEIDARDTLNSIDIAQYQKPTLFWEGNENILYILSEGKLSSSETLGK